MDSDNEGSSSAAADNGDMDAAWLSDAVADFAFVIDDRGDSDGGVQLVVDRVRRISATYALDRDGVADALIAFAVKHCKGDQRVIDVDLVDLFEEQTLAKAAGHAKQQAKRLSSVGRPTVFAQKTDKQKQPKQSVGAFYYNEEDGGEAMDVEEALNPIAGADANIVPLSGRYADFAPIKSAGSSTPYLNRQHRGAISLTLQGRRFTRSPILPTDDPALLAAKRAIRVEIVNPLGHLTKTYKYAAGEQSAELVEALCDRIDAFGELVKKANPALEEFAPCTLQTEEAVAVFGQIVGESDRLTERSAWLQSSDEVAGCVQLDLDKLADVSLFPGQMAAFEGTNPTGQLFIADRQLFPAALLPPAPFVPKMGPDDLHVWAAAGPYTPGNSMAYEPLCDLVELARKERPEALILFGPFIHCRHPHLAAAQSEAIFQQLFERLLVAVSDALDGTSVQVLIVPSAHKDAVAIPYFPTGPLYIGKECRQRLGNNIHLLADPSVVRLGGVTVALTASEVLAHLSKEEVHRSEDSENADRMGRMMSHLFRQRSLYPLYPPSADISADMKRTLLYCQLDQRPHVLLAPSNLLYCAKPIDGCLCVNPGRLARGDGGGVFAKIHVDVGAISGKKKPGEEAGKEAEGDSSVADISCVRIVKI